MRTFDPKSRIFTFRGESFDLQELVTTVEEIAARALVQWRKSLFPADIP
jgi:hypothetical protein